MSKSFNIHRLSFLAATFEVASLLFTASGRAESSFTRQECQSVTHLLLDGVIEHRGAGFNISRTLPTTAIFFIGLERQKHACDGPNIVVVTDGNREIIASVISQLKKLEKKGETTAGLAERFRSLTTVSKAPQEAPIVAWIDEGASLEKVTIFFTPNKTLSAYAEEARLKGCIQA